MENDRNGRVLRLAMTNIGTVIDAMVIGGQVDELVAGVGLAQDICRWCDDGIE